MIISGGVFSQDVWFIFFTKFRVSFFRALETTTWFSSWCVVSLSELISWCLKPAGIHSVHHILATTCLSRRTAGLGFEEEGRAGQDRISTNHSTGQAATNSFTTNGRGSDRKSSGVPGHVPDVRVGGRGDRNLCASGQCAGGCDWQGRTEGHFPRLQVSDSSPQ